MKLIDYMIYLPKGIIYEKYVRLFEKSTNYQKITRKKMLEEIVSFYNEGNKLQELCLSKEIIVLKKIKTKKIDKKRLSEKYFEEVLSLKEKLLLITDSKGKLYIPEDIIENVLDNLKHINVQKLEENETLNVLIKNILFYYKILPENDLLKIIKKYVNLNEESLKNFLLNNKFIHFYIEKAKYKKKAFWIYRDEEIPLSDFIWMYFHSEVKEYKNITLEELYNYAQNPLSKLNEEKFVQLINDLNQYNLPVNHIISVILTNAIYASDDGKIDKLLNIYSKAISTEKLSDIKNHIIDMILQLPSVMLKGYSINEYQEIKTKKTFDERFQKTMDNLENPDVVEDYLELREELDRINCDCVEFFVMNEPKKFERYQKMCQKYGLIHSKIPGNVMDNFVLYHALEEDEESPFANYVNHHLNILGKDYSIAWQVLENTEVSIFRIKKLIPSQAIVELEDIKTKKPYVIYDISLSASDPEIVNSYLYTKLIKINNITFASGCAFLFYKNLHPDLLTEIEKKKEEIKDISNDQTKFFLACFLINTKDFD